MPETYGVLERMLYILVQGMEKLPWFQPVLKVIRNDRVKIKVLRFIDWCYSLAITKKMKESRRYFSVKKVDEIVSLLADERSREIYQNMARYRMTRKHNYWVSREKGECYFPASVITLKEHEVFVDCGAYDGTDSLHFIEAAGEKAWDGIVLFEPDAGKINKIRERLAGMGIEDKVVIKNCGVWEKDTVLYLKGQGLETAVLTEQELSGTPKVRVRSLDHCRSCENATYIKMDIEGAELQALKGAEKLIRTKKPKLAVCIYHSDSDMVEIPRYLHELVPEYKFYIRHHGQFPIDDFVLYAVLEN